MKILKWTVDPTQGALAHVGIALGGADVGVAQEFLDVTDVGTVFQEVGGEAVTERMESGGLSDAGFVETVAEYGLGRGRGKGTAAVADKEWITGVFAPGIFLEYW